MNSPLSTYSVASADSPSQETAQDSGPCASPKSIPTHPPCSESTGQTCQTSETSPRRTSPHTQGQLFSAEVFPASHLALPGSAEARQMTATSGLRCFEQFGSPGPLGSLEKMLMASSTWGSPMRHLTWRSKVTWSGLSLFQLVPSGQTTEGIESGLLPTLTVCGNHNRAGLSKTSGDGLCHALGKLMPTLTARDYRHPGNVERQRNRRAHPTLPVSLGVKLTPAFCEAFMGYPEGWTELDPSEIPSSRRSRSKSSKASRPSSEVGEV